MLKRLCATLCSAAVAAMLFVPTVEAASDIDLPAFKATKGVLKALDGRRSTRELSSTALTPQQLSKILWAANGYNRPENGGRVNPAAHGEYLIDVYAIMSDGIYLYEPRDHKLVLLASGDYREFTSKKPGWTNKAPLNLVYVAYTGKLSESPHKVDPTKQALYLGVAAGTMAQSVALTIEAEGLGGCVRGSVANDDFRRLAKLSDNQEIILAQTIGALK